MPGRDACAQREQQCRVAAERTGGRRVACPAFRGLRGGRVGGRMGVSGRGRCAALGGRGAVAGLEPQSHKGEGSPRLGGRRYRISKAHNHKIPGSLGRHCGPGSRPAAAAAAVAAGAQRRGHCRPQQPRPHAGALPASRAHQMIRHQPAKTRNKPSTASGRTHTHCNTLSRRHASVPGTPLPSPPVRQCRACQARWSVRSSRGAKESQPGRREGGGCTSSRKRNEKHVWIVAWQRLAHGRSWRKRGPHRGLQGCRHTYCGRTTPGTLVALFSTVCHSPPQASST